MKKLISMVLALTMVLCLAVTAFAAESEKGSIKISTDDNHTYDVYQIFTGDFSKDGEDEVLSNLKWGKNGTGKEGEAVPSEVLNELMAANGKSDAEIVSVIENYVKFDSHVYESITGGATSSVDPGYYLLKDATPSIPEGDAYSLYIVEVVGDVTITPKKGAVTSEKKVKDVNDSKENSTTGWQDSADYDIGDKVPFLLKGTVPADYGNYETYYYSFHDTESEGLSFNNDVKVYVDGNKIETGYEVITPGLEEGCTFEVKFANLKNIPAVTAGSVITVEYTSTLDTDAVLGANGNPNKMYLEYSNNPNGTGTGKTPEDKVIVFTYQVTVNKVDPSGKALEGAGFTLYKKGIAGTYTAVGDEIKGGTSTTFTWKGLDDGDYKLVESTTPSGYNTMADLLFTITAEHDVASDDPKLTALSGGDLATGTVSTGVIEENIVNNKGTVLPETGADGTRMFMLIGSLMAAAAVVVMVTRKKMSIYKD